MYLENEIGEFGRYFHSVCWRSHRQLIIAELIFSVSQNREAMRELVAVMMTYFNSCSTMTATSAHCCRQPTIGVTTNKKEPPEKSNSAGIPENSSSARQTFVRKTCRLIPVRKILRQAQERIDPRGLTDLTIPQQRLVPGLQMTINGLKTFLYILNNMITTRKIKPDGLAVDQISLMSLTVTDFVVLSYIQSKQFFGSGF